MTWPPRLPALVLLGVLAGALGSCGTSDRCGVPGVAASCPCPGGESGARVCGDDQVWRPCNCSGAIAVPRNLATLRMDAGTDDDDGPMTGGPMTGGPRPGMQPPPMTGDDDAGMEPIDTGGTGAVGGSGGTGGTGGTAAVGGGGSGGEPAPVGEPYRSCMAATDCDPDAQCIVTAGFPANASVCAPACIDVGDCPVPDGTYEATVFCDSGFCKLDCTPVLFAPLLTCPEGMACIAPALGVAFCHDDGV